VPELSKRPRLEAGGLVASRKAGRVRTRQIAPEALQAAGR
jgi:hypothetical protein